MTSSSFLRLLLEAKKAEEMEQDATAVAVQERENLKHSPTLYFTSNLMEMTKSGMYLFSIRVEG